MGIGTDTRPELLPTDQKRIRRIMDVYGLPEDQAREVIEKSKGVSGALQGVGQKALSTASFGLSDSALSGIRRLLGGKDAKESMGFVEALQHETESENPALVKYLGQGLGIAAQAMLPGGLVAKGISKVAPPLARLAGGILPKGIGAGIENAAVAAPAAAVGTIGTEEEALPAASKAARDSLALGAIGGAAPELIKGAGLVGGTLLSGRDPRIINRLVESYKRNPNLKFGEDMPYLKHQDDLARYASDIKNDVIATGSKRHKLLQEAGDSGVGIEHEAFANALSPFDEAAARYVKSGEGKAISEQKNRYLKAAKEKFGEQAGDEIEPARTSYYQGPYEGPHAAPVEIPAEYAPMNADAKISPLHVQDTVKSLTREGRLADQTGGPKDLMAQAAAQSRGRLNPLLTDIVPGLGEMNKDMQSKLGILDKLGIKPKVTETGDYRYSPDDMNALAKRLATKKIGSDEAKNVQSLLSEAGAPPDMAQKLQDTYLQHSFQSGSPRGSRGVNLFGEIGEAIGGFGGSEKAGRLAGKAAGAVGDTLGAPIVREAAKKASKVSIALDRVPEKYKGMIRSASARGPAALEVTHKALMNKEDYNKAMSEEAQPQAGEDPWASHGGLVEDPWAAYGGTVK